jgi:hypothetical protein
MPPCARPSISLGATEGPPREHPGGVDSPFLAIECGALDSRSPRGARCEPDARDQSRRPRRPCSLCPHATCTGRIGCGEGWLARALGAERSRRDGDRRGRTRSSPRPGDSAAVRSRSAATPTSPTAESRGVISMRRSATSRYWAGTRSRGCAGPSAGTWRPRLISSSRHCTPWRRAAISRIGTAGELGSWSGFGPGVQRSRALVFPNRELVAGAVAALRLPADRLPRAERTRMRRAPSSMIFVARVPPPGD